VVPILLASKDTNPETQRTLTNIYKDAAAKWPNKAAIYSIDDDRSLTFLDIERKSNQMAHYLYQKGLRPGDVCALYMMNKPEFVVSWLAMCKIGVVGALINFQAMYIPHPRHINENTYINKRLTLHLSPYPHSTAPKQIFGALHSHRQV